MTKIIDGPDDFAAIAASKVLLSYGFGKPRETLVLEIGDGDEANNNNEPLTIEDLRQRMLARGLPVDHLDKVKTITTIEHRSIKTVEDHQIKTVEDHRIKTVEEIIPERLVLVPIDDEKEF